MKIAPLAAALFALVSCAPQAFVITPEMRGPSKSGLDLAGKSIAVVYSTDGNFRNLAFNSSAADGFATRLEEDYFGGERTVGMFTVETGNGADYTVKDSLVSLVLQTGKDVVFLFGTPELGIPAVGAPMKIIGKNLPADSSYVSQVTIPFRTRIYVYDSMNRSDKALGFSGSKNLTVEVYGDGKSSDDDIRSAVWSRISRSAENAGYTAASSFSPTWKTDEFHVIYYDGAEDAWDKGAEYAYSFKWKEAIAQWTTLLGCRSVEKKACAAYNLALGCFMAGQPDLALEWLDRSDGYMPVSLSASLRNKIRQYTGKQSSR